MIYQSWFNNLNNLKLPKKKKKWICRLLRAWEETDHKRTGSHTGHCYRMSPNDQKEKRYLRALLLQDLQVPFYRNLCSIKIVFWHLDWLEWKLFHIFQRKELLEHGGILADSISHDFSKAFDSALHDRVINDLETQSGSHKWSRAAQLISGYHWLSVNRVGNE